MNLADSRPGARAPTQLLPAPLSLDFRGGDEEAVAPLDFSNLRLGPGGKETIPQNGEPSRVYPAPPPRGETPQGPKLPPALNVLFYPLPLLRT